MLSELLNKSRVIGVKQVLRALKLGTAELVYVASDADERVVSPVLELLKEKNIPFQNAESMEVLGKSCGIDVGAAVVAVLHK